MAVGVVSMALTLWCFWPLPLNLADSSAYLGSEVPGVKADFALLVWILSWDSHALLTAPWHIFSANTFYPSPLSLAYSEHLFGLVPLFSPWYWATGNPILSVNIVILTTQVLSSLAMYALARRWTSPAAAAVGAFFYAYSGWRMATASYVHIHSVQLLPVVLLFTERWLDRGARRDWVVLTGALVLQSLTSVYLAYILFITWGAELVLTLWFRRGHVTRRSLRGVVAAGGIVVAAFGASCLPYLELRRLGVIPSFDDGSLRPSLTEMGLVPFFAASAVKAYFMSQSVGVIGAVLVALGLWQRNRERRYAVALGVAFVACGVLLAFGPGIWIAGYVLWSPYRILRGMVPGFATIRIPSRFLLIAQLGFALLASLGAARLFERARLRGLPSSAAALAIVLASLALAPLPQLPLHEEVVGARVPPAYRWLAVNGAGRPLLELPHPDLESRARRVILSTYHWLPTIDGYSAYPVRTAGYLYGIARGLPGEGALQKLADSVDVGWILVHLDDSADAEQWLHGELPVGLERVGRWQNDLLLRLTRSGDSSVRARLVSTKETMGGVPLVPLSGPCPGTIALASSPTASPIGDETRITVKVRNDSSSVWPGFAMLPRHALHVRASMIDPDGAIIARALAALPQDVRPNEETDVGVALPIRASDFPLDLTVELIQLGDAPLSECGVAPLTVHLNRPAKPSA
jgi:hypothetical protein